MSSRLALFGNPSSMFSSVLSEITSPSFPKKNVTRRDEGDISGRILNRKLDMTPTFWTLTHWLSILPRAMTCMEMNFSKLDFSKQRISFKLLKQANIRVSFRLRIRLNVFHCSIHGHCVFRNRTFSLTQPAAMGIYWNKRQCLHKKRDLLPERYINMAAVSLFWLTIKAAVTSFENAL